MKIDPHLAKLS